MTKIRSVLFLFLIITFYPERAKAQSAFAQENLKYKYDGQREIRFDYRIAESNDSFHVMISLKFMTPVSNPDLDYHIYYELRNGFNDKASAYTTTLNISKNCVFHSIDFYIYVFNIPKNQGEQLIVFHVSKNDSGINFLFDIPLRNPSVLPGSDLELFFYSTKAPVISAYVHEGDSLFIESQNSNAQRVFLYRYPSPFDAADPPMYLINKKVSKILNYDSLYTLNRGEPFTLPGPGLYFIQSDTSQMAGISIRCEEEHYPRLVKMEDIFEPIIYLSTLEELNKLKSATNKKEAFESYWLKIAKSEEKARKLIRWYYQRIEDANGFFTTYKEGWKTDMGLIYIFFGAPDEVYNNGFSEKWNYSKKDELPAISFNFIRLKNAFSSKHYILERSYDYKSSWYRRVDMFRKGIL
jgi:GWxTD domain-containing protein